MAVSQRPAGRDDSSVDRDGSLAPDRVRDAAAPAIERWRGSALYGVKRRLQGLLGASLVVLAVRLLLDPGGVTGILTTLWALLALPVAALTACVLVLLRDPVNAHQVWWDRAPAATLGLLSVAGVARAGRVSAVGRVLWQLLFGETSPDNDRGFSTASSAVDLAAVARIRRLVWYGVVSSAALVVGEGLLVSPAAGTVVTALVGSDPGPAAWASLGVGAVVVGALLGALLAAADTGRRWS